MTRRIAREPPPLNRVERILSEPDEQQRDAGYWRLYAEVHPSGKAPALNLLETSRALEFLRHRRLSLRERAWLWKLLVCGTSTSGAHEHALACLADEDTYVRGLAFLYLQTHAPDLVPELVARFAQDRSPHIRHRIASTVTEPGRRRALLEGILPDVGQDHELFDGIQLELAALKDPA